MDPHGSVSQWLDPLQEGEQAAVEALWQRYFPRLVGLARHRLGEVPRHAADEEDVALSAFDSFCRRAEIGQFPQLQDREGLWRLLVAITVAKATNLIRHENALKRGGGKRRLEETQGEQELPLIEEVVSREPTPEFAAEVAEQCRRLMQVLGDKTLERIAVLRMEGYAVLEIAERMQLSERSVERKIASIRNIWKRELLP